MPLMPSKAGRLRIAPDVLAELEPQLLSQLSDQREHTEMGCFICGRTLMPEDSTEVQVVLLASPDRSRRVVQVSHPRCMPSCVIEQPMASDFPQEWSFDWVGILRDHALSAVLLFEFCTAIYHGDTPEEMHSAFLDVFRAGGFRSATDRVDELVAPLLRQWSIAQAGDAIVLSDAVGSTHEFGDVVGGLPTGWLEAARNSQRVLVVYGQGFGLDRLRRDRLDQVLQGGDALCGLVPWSDRTRGSSPSHRGHTTKRRRGGRR